MALVVKNIGIANESTWGTAVSPTSYPRVRSVGLDASYNKSLVDDTAGTRKGFGRVVNLGHQVEGEISTYAYSDDMGWWLKGVLGGTVTSQANANGYNHVFTQPAVASSELPAFTLVTDKAQEVVRWYGARFGSLRLAGANDIVEATIGVMAKDEDTGSGYTVTSDQDLDPFTFAQVTVKIGDTLAAASGASATPVDSWELEFDNQLQSRFQSGSASLARLDPLIATCRGTFTKFYEDTNFNTWFKNDTEKAMIITATGAQIGGSDYHTLEILLPRVAFMTSERPYEAGSLIVETVTWEALYDTDVEYMIQASLDNNKENYTS